MIRTTVALTSALLLATSVAFAAPQAKPVKAATHSTSGVVQSVTDTSLVIAKVGKKAKTSATETFVVNATTVKSGQVVIGAKVGVRYITDGGHNVATAVTVTAKDADLDIPKAPR